MYQAVFDGYEEVKVDIANTVEGRDEIAAEYEVRLVMKDGEIRIARGCNVFKVRQGKIEELRCYFSPADF